VPQYDYPLPPRSAEWITGIRPGHLNLNLIAAPLQPVNQPNWPRPLIFAYRFDTTWQLNPSIALIAAPVEEPPTIIPPQYDYPLPPQIQPRPAQSFPPLLTLTAAPIAVPFKLLDWPQPQQRPRVYAEARRSPIGLLHSVYPPINQDNWPRPIQPPRVYAQSYSMGPTVLGVTPTPTAQDDWPIPKQPYRVYAEARSAFPPLLHSVYPPINLEIWPPPIQPYRVYAQSYGTNFKLLSSIQPPNEQSDWPIPIQPPRVYARSYATPATLFTAPPKPPHQDDWPLPQQSPRIYAETRRAPIDLLRSIRPFAQTDWPNPKLVLTPTSARTWIHRVNLALQAPPLPFNQFEWPIPKPSRPANDRRTYVQAAPILLGIPAQPKPVKQDAWPVPIQPVFPFWTRQFGQGAYPTIALISPPVPRVPTETRFRSPLQDDDMRPDVPDQRRPGVSAIRRQPNESPSSARDKSWRYE
jgi:hypothetical protein